MSSSFEAQAPPPPTTANTAHQNLIKIAELPSVHFYLRVPAGTFGAFQPAYTFIDATGEMVSSTSWLLVILPEMVENSTKYDPFLVRTSSPVVPFAATLPLLTLMGLVQSMGALFMPQLGSMLGHQPAPTAELPTGIVNQDSQNRGGPDADERDDATPSFSGSSGSSGFRGSSGFSLEDVYEDDVVIRSSGGSSTVVDISEAPTGIYTSTAGTAIDPVVAIPTAPGAVYADDADDADEERKEEEEAEVVVYDYAGLPRETLTVFDAWGDRICQPCRELRNLKHDSDGNVCGVFCSSCVIVLARVASNECDRRRSGCLGQKWVDALGRPSLMCKNCAKPGRDGGRDRRQKRDRRRNRRRGGNPVRPGTPEIPTRTLWDRLQDLGDPITVAE